MLPKNYAFAETEGKHANGATPLLKHHGRIWSALHSPYYTMASHTAIESVHRFHRSVSELFVVQIFVPQCGSWTCIFVGRTGIVPESL